MNYSSEYSDKTKRFLDEYVPDWEKTDDPQDILDVISDLIIEKGFNDRLDYNNFGEKAQDVYDEVYYVSADSESDFNLA